MSLWPTSLRKTVTGNWKKTVQKPKETGTPDNRDDICRRAQVVSLRLLSFHQASRLFLRPCGFVAGTVDEYVCVGGVEDIFHTNSVRYYNLCYKEPPANGLGDRPDGVAS